MINASFSGTIAPSNKLNGVVHVEKSLLLRKEVTPESAKVTMVSCQIKVGSPTPLERGRPGQRKGQRDHPHLRLDYEARVIRRFRAVKDHRRETPTTVARLRTEFGAGTNGVGLEKEK